MVLRSEPKKLHLGYLGPKEIPSHKSRTLAPFSPTGLHFLENHKLILIKLSYLKKLNELGVWDLETTFGPLQPPKKVQNLSSNFHKTGFILSRITT